MDFTLAPPPNPNPRPKPGTSSSFMSATNPIENQNAGLAKSSPTKDLVSSPRKSPEKICKVDTVSDLINAQMLLKSNEDFQIVVANNLLETSEYKAFMSHLNLPPQTPHPDDDREISSNPVLPNTPEPQPSNSR